MKRFIKFSLSFFILLVFVFTANFFGKFTPTSEYYVNDFANVLNKETKNFIISNGNALYENTTAQVVVVTLSSLENNYFDLDAVSNEIFRDFEIGDKEKNNGVLVLLAPNERKVKIEVGYGLEGRLYDSKAGRLIDTYAIDHFKKNDWNTGIKALYIAILNEVYEEYNISPPQKVEDFFEKSETQKFKNGKNILLLIFLLISLILIFFRKKLGISWIWPFFFGGKGGFGGFSGKGSDFGGFFVGGGESSGGGGASRDF